MYHLNLMLILEKFWLSSLPALSGVLVPGALFMPVLSGKANWPQYLAGILSKRSITWNGR